MKRAGDFADNIQLSVRRRDINQVVYTCKCHIVDPSGSLNGQDSREAPTALFRNTPS